MKMRGMRHVAKEGVVKNAKKSFGLECIVLALLCMVLPSCADKPVSMVYPGKLVASDGSANDWFGLSVSASADGSTIVVGALFDDVDVNTDQGSAYVYRWNGSSWSETRLVASDGRGGDQFGNSVSVSSDGSTVVVGAHEDDINGRDSGAVYVYKWNESSWNETKLMASDGAAVDYFGWSVAVSSDGAMVVVGAYKGDVGVNVNQGSAYVYKWNGSSWNETKLVASDGDEGDWFGVSVYASADGSTIVVGAPSDDVDANTEQGSAYVYKWNGSSWNETKLTASDGAAYDSFGGSVSVLSDGTMVVVGAPMSDDNGNSGLAYVYRWTGNSWQETKIASPGGEEYDRFGMSVSISQDGSIVVIGAPYFVKGENKNQGSAYVYKWNGESWSEVKLTPLDGAMRSSLGISVSASSDGSIIVVGAFLDDVGTNTDQGSAYVYKWNGSAYVVGF
ncbi:MAG: FG-GAP repeat protein [Deltaproteobacteria bacterium]|nr:FG-GAP repeat protein [Deltaproteobacteria bacterium]